MLNIRKTNKNTRRKRSRTGVVAAEMAVVLPVFLIVFFGFIEVARLSFAVNSTQVALIKSARTLSLPNATADAGRKAAEDYLNGVGVKMDNLVITVTPEDLNTWRQFRTPSTEQLRVAASKRTSPIKLTGEPLIVALIYDN